VRHAARGSTHFRGIAPAERDLAADRFCSSAECVRLSLGYGGVFYTAGHVRAIRGGLSDIVFKTYGRKIIVTRTPTFAGYVSTAAQHARRDRMREATAYAKRIYAEPRAWAFYAATAKKLGRQPFRLAVSDYLTGHARATEFAHVGPTSDSCSDLRVDSREVCCLRQKASKKRLMSSGGAPPLARPATRNRAAALGRH
jgi:hypothetical protein